MAQDETKKYPVIFASGGIIPRQTPKGTEILIIHRSRYDDWCLPKGKLKGSESFPEAAIREVKEETGYDTRITGFAGCVDYEVDKKQKVVLFWNMEAVGECSFKPSDEVLEIRWLSVENAEKTLDYSLEKDLLMKVFNKP